MAKAYSYLRFSTPEQMRGDSFRRQSTLAVEYAVRHGLEMDEALTFRDLGVSAFRGTNARTGALGAFLRAVDDGLVPPGAVLLVESLDRVTRQDPWDALPVFQQIINAGVTLVTLQDGKTYSRAEMRENPMRILESLFVMIRANEESATKARRLRAAWEGKRQKVKAEPLTAVCPGWLRLDRTTGRFAVLEERAAVIRRIYDLAAAGVGQHAIAATLDAEQVETFGHYGRRAEFWRRSYIAKIVENPAVVGTLVPHAMTYEGGKRTRKALDPIPGYYPPVVDEETFQRVRALRLGDHRASAKTGTGAPSSLLAGLAECPECGATMTRVSKGSGPKAGKPRLVCVRAKARRCGAPSAALADVEEGLARDVERMIGEAPVGGEELQAAVERADAAADHVSELVREAEADWRVSRSLATRRRLTDLEAEWDLKRAELRELEQRRAAAGPGLVKRLAELRETLQTAPMDRAKGNALLRQVIKSVVVDPRHGVLTLRWHNGGESTLSYGWAGAV